MVPDGLGQDMVSLMKDWIARCEVSGRMTSSRKYGLGWSIKDSIPRCKVSGRIASSWKYGLGWSGPGVDRFDKGMNS